jgi:hypothetical protein
MLKLGSELDLTPKPVEHDRPRELGGEDLQDNLPIEGDLVREEDARHAAAAKFTLDCVAGPKSGLKLESELVGQYYLARMSRREGRCSQRYGLAAPTATVLASPN